MDNKALFEKLSKNRRHLANELLSPAVAGFWRMVIDKYSEKAHFLYELLQNADDAKATTVRIILEQTGVYFIHNGNIPFSVTDPDLEGTGTTIGHINSLTSVGCSTKLNSESVIGKFGIGFKSVFQYTNHPHIEDDNFSFGLIDYIVPVSESRIGNYRQGGETMFYLPFSNPSQANVEILSSLQQMQNPLSFLNHLDSFTWQTATTEDGRTFIKQVLSSDRFRGLDNRKIKHDLVRLDSSLYHYFTTTIEHDSKSFNCSIVYGADVYKEFEPIKAEQNVFCFFPTEESLLGLPFLIHAPFLLTENRERIKRDEAWDIQLLDVLAQVAASILFYEPFRNSISYNRLVDFFPLDDSLRGEFITSSFIDNFKSTLITETVIKTEGGEFASVNQILYCNNSEFTKLFSPFPCDVLGQPNLLWGYSFLYELSATERTRTVELLSNLGLMPNYQSVEYLLDHLETSFIENQEKEWIFKFYKFLAKHRSLCASDTIRVKDIILCDDGIFRAVYSSSHTPQIFLKSESADRSTEGLYYVDSSLNAADMALFCSAMGIDKPSEATYVEKTLLLKYSKGEIDRDNISTIAADIDRLANYYSIIAYNLEAKKRFLGLLKDVPFVASVKNGEKCFSCAEIGYFYSDDLYKYFADTVTYVDQALILAISASNREKVYFFLHSIGVAFYPRIKSVFRTPSNPVLENLDLHPVSLRARDNGGQIIEDKEIDGFSFLLNNWTKEAAVAFFRLLGKMVGESGAFSFKNMLCGRYSYYEKGKKTETVNPILKTTAYRYLFEGCWLPSNMYTSIKLSEVVSNDNLCLECMNSDMDFQTLQFLGVRYDSSLANLTENQRYDINLVKQLKMHGITEEDMNALVNGTATIVYRKN